MRLDRLRLLFLNYQRVTVRHRLSLGSTGWTSCRGRGWIRISFSFEGVWSDCLCLFTSWVSCSRLSRGSIWSRVRSICVISSWVPYPGKCRTILFVCWNLSYRSGLLLFPCSRLLEHCRSWLRKSQLKTLTSCPSLRFDLYADSNRFKEQWFLFGWRTGQ